MRILLVAAVFAALTQSAYAQFKPSINLMQDQPKDEATEQRRKDIESEYKSTVSKIPDQKKKSTDPWQNLRGTEPAKKPPN